MIGFLLLTAAPAAAQSQREASADEAAVRAVIDRLFDGMRERDAEGMTATFLPQARLYGIGRDGEVRETPMSDFVGGVLRAPPDVLLDEVLGEVEIRIDGPLATAWTYYDFYAGGNFSHCGYNAFTLLNAEGEWRIVSIADSRRSEGCMRARGE